MMPVEIINVAFYIMWAIIVFTSVCFFISGIDDLFIDIYYWIYFVWRYKYVSGKRKLTYEMLVQHPQQRIAVMVACWHEAGVIEEMLRYNVNMIDYQHYDIFVGVYPNDEQTVNAVKMISELFVNVHYVINKEEGPTNKAKNLNNIYHAIEKYEDENQFRYDIFVVHDSEDIIHPYSFLLYNYLMPKNHMVQVPIFPLDVSLRFLVHWTYNSEFSELHTKDIVVREKIGGLVPSAGVGTAFSKKAIELLKDLREGIPFSTATLTEDYSTSLELKLHDMRQIFVLQHIKKTYWSKKWYFFGAVVPRVHTEFIATRSVFPLAYFAAVRQKTRWILGINFQEWIRTGWKGNFATQYTLFHDRKSIFTHFINALFFAQLLFWIVYLIITADLPEYPTLQDLLAAYPWVWVFILISSFFMLNRFLQRTIALYRIYGFVPALFSAPLIIYGNFVNLHALLRAYYFFIFTPASKNKSVKWDKTDHVFPKHDELTFNKIKLGNILLEHKILSKNQLIRAITQQAKTGEQLGTTLINMGLMTSPQLTKILAAQYRMKIIKRADAAILPHSQLMQISTANYHKLLKNHCYPVAIENGAVLLAVESNYNEDKLLKFIRWMKPYSVHFAMLDDTDSEQS